MYLTDEEIQDALADGKEEEIERLADQIADYQSRYWAMREAELEMYDRGRDVEDVRWFQAKVMRKWRIRHPFDVRAEVALG